MSENQLKKESVLKKGVKTFNKLPNVVKIIVLALIIVPLLWIGVTSKFSTHSKATKFGLENMGELVTQTAYVTIVQDSKDHKEFFNLFKLPFSTSRMIFSYDFSVDASVNFEQISYDINDKKKEIKVKLPHAKHYKTTMAVNSLEVYLDDDGLFSRIDLKELNQAEVEMEEEAKNTAIANNLLEAADKNAQKILETMFKSASKYQEYNVVYEYID